MEQRNHLDAQPLCHLRLLVVLVDNVVLEEDDGGAVVAGALAELHEALLDVLAAAARRPEEVHNHQRARRPRPLQEAGELLVRLELRHALHRADLVVLLHGRQARQRPVRAPPLLAFAAALRRRGGVDLAAAEAEWGSWERVGATGVGREGAAGGGCGEEKGEGGGEGKEGGDHGCIVVVSWYFNFVGYSISFECFQAACLCPTRYDRLRAT